MGKRTKEAPPALDPDVREQQLIALAVDEAEKRIRDGSASSQLLCHYLKLGSSRERAEREKLENENQLLKAKCKSLETFEQTEARYIEVINAIKGYRGEPVEVDDGNTDYGYN